MHKERGLGSTIGEVDTAAACKSARGGPSSQLLSVRLQAADGAGVGSGTWADRLDGGGIRGALAHDGPASVVARRGRGGWVHRDRLAKQKEFLGFQPVASAAGKSPGDRGDERCRRRTSLIGLRRSAVIVSRAAALAPPGRAHVAERAHLAPARAALGAPLAVVHTAWQARSGAPHAAVAWSARLAHAGAPRHALLAAADRARLGGGRAGVARAGGRVAVAA